MNKIIIVMMMLLICLSGCTTYASQQDAIELESKISALQEEVTALEKQKSALESEVIDKKKENGTAKYVITFKCKQSHFSLDPSEHLKDSINKITFDVIVDKEYFDSVDVGDVVNDEFRIGSLIMKGSFGNWKVTIDNKEII